MSEKIQSLIKFASFMILILLITLSGVISPACAGTSITVVSPEGGVNWIRGTAHTIKWTSEGSPGAYVKIELLRNMVQNRVITSSTPNDGSYSWKIPSTQTPGTDYRIRITSTTNPAYSDIKNKNFIISAGTAPSISSLTVTSPNGGENMVRGTANTIRWSSSGSPGTYVKIELLKNGNLNSVIVSSTANDGSYSWTIPSQQTAGTDYKIKVTSTTNLTYTDRSNNNFNINVASPPSPPPNSSSVTLLKDNFDQYNVGYIVGQGGWALSEDQPEAPNKSWIVSPGLNGSQRAFSFQGRDEGASKSFTRTVRSEKIAVEFDLLPTSLGKVNIGLRSGTTSDGIKGSASMYIKIESGKFYHIKKTPSGHTSVEFTGVSYVQGKQFHAKIIVNYIENTTRLQINGVLSPIVATDWLTTLKPGLIDIKSGAVGSKLDNLTVYVVS